MKTVSTIASSGGRRCRLTRPASHTPPDQRARQQRDAEAGADTAKDRLQRAELHQPLHRDAAPRQQRLQPLAIGTAGAQHDDARTSPAVARPQRRDTGRGQHDQFLPEHHLLDQRRVRHRPADERAIHPLLQAPPRPVRRGAGAQRQIDLRTVGGIARQQRRQAQRGGRLQ